MALSNTARGRFCRGASSVYLGASLALLAGGAEANSSAASLPLPAETQTLLQSRSIPASAPLYIRIFKEDSELEVWKARADGRYVPVKTFPICTWSGALGPKQTQGDQMAPEGFYTLSAGSLKPDSKYHLALNIGYPNALDRALGRSGNFIMVHGSCVSVGCFAMTDPLIEEIYAFVREAMAGGQEAVPLHIFPFRMTAANLKRHEGHAAAASWQPLREAYDDFQRTQEPPRIGVCGMRYVVNPLSPLSADPSSACPSALGKLLAPLSPRRAAKLAKLAKPVVAPGQKTRTLDNIASWSPSSAPVATAASTKAKAEARARLSDMGGVTPLLTP